MATLLRTDRALYRPLVPDSETAQELRTLTRDRAELVRTRTMLSNQLTAYLKAYFPDFLVRASFTIRALRQEAALNQREVPKDKREAPIWESEE